jgi:parvulin-like peptidyl-prolyl isomerase
MKKYPAILVLSVLSAVAPSIHAADTQPVIARVGTEDIKAEMIRPYLDALSPADREALAANPQVLSQTVRSLILQQVLLKEALATGWDQRPDVQSRLEQAREALIAESYLAEVAKVAGGYPSEAEIREVYEARKDELQIPKQYELAQIFVASAANGTPLQDAAIKQRVDAVAAKLKKGDFAEVATTDSDEKQSGSRGGNLGWVAEANLQPEIRKAVGSLAKGATSGPIKLEDGTYFVKVIDVQDTRTASLDEVKDRFAQLLREQRARQNRDAYLARLQQQTPMTVNEIGLSSLLEEPKKPAEPKD